MAGESGPTTPEVPRLLRIWGGWAWRLLAIGLLIYGVAIFLHRLYILVIPVVIALFATALLHPLTDRLRRHRVPSIWATWLTLILAIAVVAGVLSFIGTRASDEFPTLENKLENSVTKVHHYLRQGPFHVSEKQLTNFRDEVKKAVTKNKKRLISGALETGRAAAEVATALIFAFFLTFFFLYDGRRIWDWCIGLFPPTARPRVRSAGRHAWATLSGYIQGVFMVAAFHGIVIAIALTVMGVPLVAPLALLVFIGAFIPIVGAVIAGGAAVLIALVTTSGIKALILLGILLIDNQIEAHLLHPLVVGRRVRLHPVAVAVVLVAGTTFAGIFGAIVAVPFAAAIYRAWPAMLGREALLPEEEGTISNAPPPEENTGDSPKRNRRRPLSRGPRTDPS